MSVSHHEAQFDEFAPTFDGGMTHPLKRMSGTSRASFIDVKVRWLQQRLATELSSTAGFELLDYGCGDGLFVERLYHFGFTNRMRACDVSQGMLGLAQQRLRGIVQSQDLVLSSREFDDSTFEVLLASAVLHHVPVSERMAVCQEFARVLTPGGWCFLFEHNPFHPFVQLIVRTTRIDRDAELLTPRGARGLLNSVGLHCQRTEWLMFYPPKWEWARFIDSWLYHVPLGGQYVVAAQKQC